MLVSLGESILTHSGIHWYSYIYSETLHAEAAELESSILRLTSPPSPSQEGANTTSSNPANPETANTARSQIQGLFSACLPVIRARMSNLAMAQDLIDGAQENLSISLRMESLGMD